MAITDAERHRLHTKLDQVLGEEDAAVLISHLPPSGWSDVARTRDLDVLEARIAARFERIDTRIDRLEARMDERFGRVDGQFTQLEAKMDDRFAITEARFDAAIERAMREQTNRFFIFTGGAVTLLIALQQVLAHFG